MIKQKIRRDPVGRTTDNATRYDWQHIILTSDDLRANANNLQNKNRNFTRYFWNLAISNSKPEEVTSQRHNLTNHCRIYIIGHGDLGCVRLAGLSGKAFAERLGPLLGGVTPKRISLVACFSTMWSQADEVTMGARIQHNFAQVFHYYLGEQYKIYTEVSARGAAITVGQDGRKKTGFLDPNATFYDASQFQNKVRENKLIYYWEEEGEPMDTSD